MFRIVEDGAGDSAVMMVVRVKDGWVTLVLLRLSRQVFRVASGGGVRVDHGGNDACG
jgi:hypothetical protein